MFALPITVGNLLQQLYNVADSIIVGNFVGQTALSAVGTCAPMTILFIAFAIGTSNGSAVIVAQYFGAQRREELRKDVSTALLLLVGFGLAISIIAIGFARPLLAVVMGTLALKLGVPTSLQQCVVSFGRIAIQRMINSFGEGLMAAATVKIRLQQFITVPAVAFQAGMSTFTGQNVGAEKVERVPGGYHATLGMSSGVCLVLSALAWIFAEPLIVLFGVESMYIALAVEYVRFAACCYVLFALYQTTAGLLSGAGDVLVIALLTLGSLGVRTIAVYIMAYLTPIGQEAAWISMPISWGLALLISVLRYKFGPWRQKSIVKNGVKSGSKDETAVDLP